MLNPDPGRRLLEALPAVYAMSDRDGELGRLLGSFEALLFKAEEGSQLPGIEQKLQSIPELLDPLAMPDRFVGWLAAWLGFTPHALFDAPVLRGIIPELVHLHGSRGTRHHLERLLALCFGKAASFAIDDRPSAGLLVGSARMGISSRLSLPVPFRFTVRASLPGGGMPRGESLEGRIRAVIDYAKPAHTRYELAWADPPAPPPA
ncbi:hypothetical protein [Ideonella sp. YS5]|uniref:hypothetical protein n=1 Tax=Ideonella sp. YS5 TaxID=3453714 RepID=UPI003EE9061E